MLPVSQIRAELGTVNKETRTVDLVWSSGAKGLRYDWETGPYYEELSMDPAHVDMSRLTSGTSPVLAVHDRQDLDAVIGVTDKAWLENGLGKATVRFSSTDPNADKVFQKVQERILRNVSVGYLVQEYTDISKPGDQYPTLLATRWQPQEISIVPIGFDSKAVTRNAQTPSNEVEIITRSNIKETEMSDTQKKETPSPVDVEALTKEAKAQEKTRIASIKKAVKAAKLSPEFADELINRDLSMSEASEEIFKELEKQSTKVASAAVTVTRDEKETKIEGVKNVLLARVNPTAFKLDDNGRRFHGMSMNRIVEDLIGRKLGESDQALATRALTTSDLPNILANVAEKSMRQAYAAQTPSFTAWTKAGTLRNYKTANRLMLGDFPSLESVDEHGEFRKGKVTESKETIQLVRYGKTIAFTKEMIINDDMNALANFSSKAGSAASRLESSLVYTSVLLANPTMGDTGALFNTTAVTTTGGHANLASSGANPDVTTVGAGFAAMRKQKTLDRVDYLNLEPRYIICGPAIETIVRQFCSTAMLATQFTAINPFANKLQPVVDPRITGNDWYLAADPSQIDTIELARLEGEEGPLVTVEQGSTPGSVKITCEHSAGASVLDFRGLYKNPGA